MNTKYMGDQVLIGQRQSKTGAYKIHAFVNNLDFAETLQAISFQMTCTSCTDESRVKVPSFQNRMSIIETGSVQQS